LMSAAALSRCAKKLAHGCYLEQFRTTVPPQDT
jgi:hypothetical protein